jgi:hypothetical protein
VRSIESRCVAEWMRVRRSGGGDAMMDGKKIVTGRKWMSCIVLDKWWHVHYVDFRDIHVKLKISFPTLR